MEPVRHPSTGWYWIAAGLALVGVLGAIALCAVGYVQLQDRLEALPRTDVPGTVTVDVDGPQGVTIFYEDPTQGGFVARAGDANTLRFSPVDLAVTGPDGASLDAAPYAADLRLHAGSRVAVALATFDAPSAGTYTIDVTGDVPSNVRVSAGDVVDGGLVAYLVVAIALFLLAAAAAVAMAVVTAVKRSRTPRTPAPRDRTLTPA